MAGGTEAAMRMQLTKGHRRIQGGEEELMRRSRRQQPLETVDARVQGHLPGKARRGKGAGFTTFVDPASLVDGETYGKMQRLARRTLQAGLRGSASHADLHSGSSTAAEVRAAARAGLDEDQVKDISELRRLQRETRRSAAAYSSLPPRTQGGGGGMSRLTSTIPAPEQRRVTSLRAVVQRHLQSEFAGKITPDYVLEQKVRALVEAAIPMPQGVAPIRPTSTRMHPGMVPASGSTPHGQGGGTTSALGAGGGFAPGGMRMRASRSTGSLHGAPGGGVSTSAVARQMIRKLRPVLQELAARQPKRRPRKQRSRGGAPAPEGKEGHGPPLSPIRAEGGSRGGSRARRRKQGKLHASDLHGTRREQGRQALESLRPEEVKRLQGEPTENNVIGGWSNLSHKKRIGHMPPKVIVASRVLSHYPWEEEGDWLTIARYEEAKAEEEAEQLKKEKLRKKHEEKVGLEKHLRIRREAREKAKREQEEENERIREDTQAAHREKAEKERRARAEREVRKKEVLELLDETRVRKAAAEEAARLEAEREARAAADEVAAEERRLQARKQAEKEKLQAFLKANEAELGRREEAAKREAEEDVKMMEAQARELERQEEARRQVFVKQRERQEASIQSSAGAFDKRYAEEREMDRKIAEHERRRQEADRIAEERAKLRQVQLKHDLRESHAKQLAYLRAERQREIDDDQRVAQQGRQAAKEYADRKQAEARKERERIAAMRRELDAQIDERLAGETVGLTGELARINEPLVREAKDYLDRHGKTQTGPSLTTVG